MSEQSEQKPGVVELVDAGVPADQGLSSLGLIMQLAGSVFAAYATLATFVMVLALSVTHGGSDRLWVFLVLAMCIARSLVHRMAGTEILYGKRTLEGATGSPLAGIRRYVIVGIAHSVVVALIMGSKFDMPGKLTLSVGLGLALWPAVLGALTMLPRFQRFAAEVPVSEDKGFEAAAILMTVLGLCGVLGTGGFLYAMLDAGGRALQQGPGVLIMLATVMLVIRSCLHVQAGLSGLRETSVDRSVELANRYANFGVISSFCAAGSLLLLAMTSRLDVSGLAMVSGICWLLMTWPLIIRRFFSDRQFADLLAGDKAQVHRRAPDAGLTGLGWLLLAQAVLGASFLLPELVAGPEAFYDGGRGMGKLTEMISFMGPLNMKSIWWSAGLIGLQAWAGFELIRMNVHHRVIGTIYAVVSAAVTMYTTWPMMKAMVHLRHLSPENMLLFIPLAIQLVVPVATLILVNRKLAPTAFARFRTTP